MEFADDRDATDANAGFTIYIQDFYVLFEQKYKQQVSVCVCVCVCVCVMLQVKNRGGVLVYEDLAGHTSGPWLLG